MAGYGLDYWAVYDTPLRLFWLLSRNLDRIQAERDMRAIRVGLAAAGTKEGLRSHLQELQREVGTVFVERPYFDRKAWDELASLANPRKVRNDPPASDPARP